MKSGDLTKNSILLFINKFSGTLATLFLLPLYTHYFSAENYGMVDLAIGYIALLALIASLKIDMGVFKHLIEARGNQDKTRHIITSAIKLLMAILTLLLITAFILGLFVKIPFYSLIVGAIVSNILFTIFSQISRGLGFTRNFVAVSISVTLVSFLITIIGIVLLQASAEIILVSLICSQLLGATALATMTKVHTYLSLKSPSIHLQKQILKYSAPLVLDGMSFWIMNTSSRTILTIALGATANGVYAIASKFTMIIEQIIGVFFQAFIETATVYANKPNKSELYTGIMTKYLRILWSGCILLIAVMPFLFPILVRGQEFASAYAYIPLMIIAVMPRALQNFISAVYQANGLTKQIATTTMLGAAINLIVSISLVYFIGIWAAVVASVITYLALSTYRYFDIRRYGIHLKMSRITLASFVALLLIILPLYYADNFWLDIVNVIIALSAGIAMNRKTLIQITKRVFDIKTFN
jgi:O-antigen/teichoic acid export membrane protein